MQDDPNMRERPVQLEGPEGLDLHSDGEAHDIASDFGGLESTTEAVRPWRIAEALKTLRGEINAAFPNRSKLSDGAIGDAAHASRASDHNPWVIDGPNGVVTAVDITNDPNNGCSANAIVEAIRAARDPRVKYMIWNRRIASSDPKGTLPAWAWRTYTGLSPHDHHCHISVKSDKAHYDSTAAWSLQARGEAAERPAPAEAEVENAFAALQAGLGERPILELLVDAQDAIPRLLARLAQLERMPAGDDTTEARPSLESLRAGYDQLWQSCTIRPDFKGQAAWHVGKLRANKPRYDQVAAATGVPWWFVGIVHALEASFNFGGHLHNGDPLTARTVHVPRARPATWNPPSDWSSSAIDAITLHGLAHLADWSIAAALYRLEGYNGFGYRPRGINSPYLWSFTNHYTTGKFVADGHFDVNAVSRQCGAAAMLKALQASGAVTLAS